MKTLLTLLLLTLSAPSMAAAPGGGHDDPAIRLKSAIDRDWVAKAGDFGSVVVTSPAYAMPYQQGCVIHELYFPGGAGGPSPGHMLANDRYFVFASGDACASADPGQFFAIEPANDVAALLDFAKRLKDGPRPGQDRLPKGGLGKVSACFAPEAMASTRIARAHSWKQGGSGRDDRYQVTLHCKALEDQGEIVALGVRGQDAVDWRLRPWGQVGVDLPAAPEVE